MPVTPEIGVRVNSPGFDLGPETNETVVKAAVAAIPNKLPDGPFKPD